MRKKKEANGTNGIPVQSTEMMEVTQVTTLKMLLERARRRSCTQQQASEEGREEGRRRVSVSASEGQAFVCLYWNFSTPYLQKVCVEITRASELP